MTDGRLTPQRPHTLADLIHGLGDIPLSRVRLVPPIGTATATDVERHDGYELVDGTLVERSTGWLKGFLAVHLNSVLSPIVRGRNLGILVGPRGPFDLGVSVRSADLAYIAWDRLPGRRIPQEPILAVAPDLAVDILGESNTPMEMARKRRECFAAGTRLVWMVDPVGRTVDVYTSETEVRTLTEADTLDGGAVLPGFAVAVREVFAELDRHG